MIHIDIYPAFQPIINVLAATVTLSGQNNTPLVHRWGRRLSRCVFYDIKSTFTSLPRSEKYWIYCTERHHSKNSIHLMPIYLSLRRLSLASRFSRKNTMNRNPLKQAKSLNDISSAKEQNSIFFSYKKGFSTSLEWPQITKSVWWNSAIIGKFPFQNFPKDIVLSY